MSEKALNEEAMAACRYLDPKALQRVLKDLRMNAPAIADAESDKTLLHIISPTKNMDFRLPNAYDEAISNAEILLDMLLQAGCSLSKRDSQGYTPFSLALGNEETEYAELLLEKSEQDPKEWESPVPILILVASWGSEEILEHLLRMGLQIRAADYDNTSPLHNLGSQASLALATRLNELFPNAYKLRANGRLPSELHLTNMNYWSCTKSGLEVLEFLIQPLILHSETEDVSKLWEYFASILRYKEW
ncbi:hypothetical protein EsH8_III_000028 [Colletotrichum jinshuiense]